MRNIGQDLLDSVQAALVMNGVPLTERQVAAGRSGAVVRIERHGVSVYWWQQAGESAAPAEARSAGRAVGGASVASPVFTETLRLAAVLADAGYHTDHLGDRVLVGRRP
ncbi:hypothetical protein [Kitasatospora sp. NPDC057015]|uniref:hypothetical protein n=1 Tax=Kitasatospora sp. NPDC057015 TaxID=3346001 RepID=UPI0036355B22